jgi:hypothetical protein
VGLVEQVGVGAVNARDTKVDDPAAGRGSGALLVRRAGGPGAEPLAAPETLAVTRVVTRCSGTGADRHVRGTELGGLAISAGGEIGDRRRVEKP